MDKCFYQRVYDYLINKKMSFVFLEDGTLISRESCLEHLEEKETCLENLEEK